MELVKRPQRGGVSIQSGGEELPHRLRERYSREGRERKVLQVWSRRGSINEGKLQGKGGGEVKMEQKRPQGREGTVPGNVPHEWTRKKLQERSEKVT